MSASSDVPNKRFKIQHDDLLIDGIHIDGVTWRLRFACRNESALSKQLHQLANSLGDGLEERHSSSGRMFELTMALPEGPVGMVFLLDYLFSNSKQSEVTKRLFLK